MANCNLPILESKFNMVNKKSVKIGNSRLIMVCGGVSLHPLIRTTRVTNCPRLFYHAFMIIIITATQSFQSLSICGARVLTMKSKSDDLQLL